MHARRGVCTQSPLDLPLLVGGVCGAGPTEGDGIGMKGG